MTSPFTVALTGHVGVVPATVTGLTFSPSTVQGGAATTATVTLSGVAPNGGQVVTLATDNAAALTLPATVTVPAGKSSYSFTINTNAAAATTTVNVTASANASSITTPLTITPVILQSLTVAPNPVVGGIDVTGTVTLSAAQTDDVTVSLACVNGIGVTLPTSVPVKAGTTSSTFTIHTAAVNTASTVTVTASALGFTQSAPLTVNPTGNAPTISIVTDAANYTAPATVKITATLTKDAGAAFTKVDFYAQAQGGKTLLVGTSTTIAANNTCVFSWPGVNGGVYQVTAIVTDSKSRSATSNAVSITVTAPPTVPTPVITPAGGTFVGSKLVTITDSQAGSSIFYTLDGTDPTFSATRLRYIAPFNLVQSAKVRSAAQQIGYASSAVAEAAFTINDSTNNNPALQAVLTGPTDGSEITTGTSITGTVTPVGASSTVWQIDYRYNDDVSPWITLGSGSVSAKTNVSAKLDPTLLMDGQFQVRLYAVDAAGNVDYDINTVIVKGHQKIGEFSLAFTDMTIPIGGIPITVTRSYDSRDKSQGDFGVGWRLGMSDAKIQVSGGKLGENWNEIHYSTTISAGGVGVPVIEYDVFPSKQKLVTITLPGDQVFNFRVEMNPKIQFYEPVEYGNLVFTAQTGTHATLKPVDTRGDVVVQSDNGFQGAAELLDLDTDITDAQEYILTLHNGTQFLLKKGVGIESITDRSGNVVSFSHNGPNSTVDGISSSVGNQGVSIQRNGAGEITSIKNASNPDAKSLVYGYDAAGNLVSFTDRVGNTTTFDYDPQHNMTVLHDPRGITAAQNLYDSQGRIQYTQDAKGNRVKFYYDQTLDPNGIEPGIAYLVHVPAGSQVTTDQLGVPTVTAYDSYGNVTDIQKPLLKADGTLDHWVKTSYRFGDKNNPEKITATYLPLAQPSTGNNGTPATLTYSVSGDMLTARDQSGNGFDCTYNAYGQLLTVKDIAGNVVLKRSYDVAGNLIQIEDAVGAVSTLRYSYYVGIDSDGNLQNWRGRLLSISNALNGTTAFNYDKNGRVVSRINPIGATTYYGYDSDGNQISKAVGRTTTSGFALSQTLNEYDDNDRLSKMVSSGDGIQLSTRYAYNEIGLIANTTDLLGNTTVYKYDDSGLRTGISYPDGGKASFEFDAIGREIKSTSKQGTGVATHYDSLGHVTALQRIGISGQTFTDINGNSASSLVVYDDDGNIIRSTGFDGRTNQYSYDVLDRPISITNGVGAVTRYTYNLIGKISKVTDPNGNSANYEYDAKGRQTIIRYADGTTRQTSYDLLDRIVSETSAEGNIYSYTYDNVGRVLSMTDPLGATTRYSYDEFGDLLTTTDANGHKTQMEYDSLGRLLSRTLPAGETESYAYDMFGRQNSHTDFNGHSTNYTYENITEKLTGIVPDPRLGQDSIQYSYDAYGRLSKETRGNLITSFDFDDLGRVATEHQPYGDVKYTYDSLGRVLFTGSNGGKSYYKYDAAGRLSVVADDTGVIGSMTYDKAGNLAQISRQNGLITSYRFDTLNRPISISSSNQSFIAYAYTPDGRKATKTDADGTVQYTYDSDGHLTGEFANGIQTNYAYDLVGNRKQMLVGSTLTEYAYDPDDRLTQAGITNMSYDRNGNLINDGNSTLTYDFQNKLLTATSHNHISAYQYDASGRRIAKIVDGIETRSVLNNSGIADNVLDELRPDSTIIKHIDYGDSALRIMQDAAFKYPLNDDLDTRLAMSTATGVVQPEPTHDAFGVISQLANANGGTQFAGMRYDAETGWYYDLNRYYVPALGRFNSRDINVGEIGNPTSMHPYIYANDNPLTNTDPTGTTTMVEMEAGTLPTATTLMTAQAVTLGGAAAGEAAAGTVAAGTTGTVAGVTAADVAATATPRIMTAILNFKAFRMMAVAIAAAIGLTSAITLVPGPGDESGPPKKNDQIWRLMANENSPIERVRNTAQYNYKPKSNDGPDARRDPGYGLFPGLSATRARGWSTPQAWVKSTYREPPIPGEDYIMGTTEALLLAAGFSVVDDPIQDVWGEWPVGTAEDPYHIEIGGITPGFERDKKGNWNWPGNRNARQIIQDALKAAFYFQVWP